MNEKEAERQQMIEDFAAMVDAIEKNTRPWRIACGVMALITVLCLVKIILM